MTRGNSASRMRQDWDERAAENALHYIDTRRPSWEPDAFFEEGRIEARKLLDPALERLGFDPSGRRILEIGCGAGRMFLGFGEAFAEVWGIDVSPEMVKLGRELCPFERARFLLGDGESLTGVDDGSVDYCFSYLVFHHLPDASVIEGYFAEIPRVLAPGGCCQIQLLASRSLKDRVSRRLPALQRLLTRRPVPGDIDTWVGASMEPRNARARAEHHGLVDVATYPMDSSAYWLVGRNPT